MANEPALRFVRYQDLVFPESASQEAGLGLEALAGTLKSLLDDAPPPDPLPARFREVAARGRVGMIVTRLDVDVQDGTARAETTLFARLAGDRWSPVSTRTATVRPTDARPEEADAIGADPQVKSILGAIDGLGLGDLAPTLKNTGAASKRALGLARSELQKEISIRSGPAGHGVEVTVTPSLRSGPVYESGSSRRRDSSRRPSRRSSRPPPAFLQGRRPIGDGPAVSQADGDPDGSTGSDLGGVGETRRLAPR